MSYRISSAQHVVALVGGTGNLGKEVSNVFLTSYRTYFSRIIIVGRDITTPAARELAGQGAELRAVDTANLVSSFTQAFQGVDVVVNVSSRAPNEYHNALFEAALKSSVKVYFPSEFGSDYRLNDFPGWDDVTWTEKREHVDASRALSKGKVKIIAVATGLFLETALGPWLGFDTANLTYTSVGSPDVKTAVTAKVDIGRAVAELTLLALSPDTASQVPDDVRIAGDNKSFREIRDIVQRVRTEFDAKPAGEIVLKTVELGPFREQLRKAQLEKPAESPLQHIKIVIAEGKQDFSKENSDELVNPGQKVWKWKTVEDYVREVRGQPFA
ncbi:uncharacterized protein FIBRA_07675 [Fibroporia radiculosa]|uniref:NmrA-like domain-containing protein n=1 Tax=Fibroporia radiculosa TaxID=599839 RepID=J4GVF3_9APHY|nr:uncharacterized protein FIBRA_07675 [Fibroporia radiculosa]CCM05455.1 predicted protein [Fibroporia radiculosa]